MARRRSPGGGGGGGVNPILAMYMQSLLQRRNQEQQHELAMNRMREQQGIDTAQTFLPDIRAGKMMPGALPPEVTARLGGEAAVRGMLPSQMSMETPTLEQLQKATSQEDVPDIQTLIAQRAARGPITELGPLTSTLQARQDTLGRIDRNQELAMDRGFAEKEGGAYATAKGTERAAADFFPAQLNRSTMEEQNKNVLAQQQASSMIPIEAQKAGAVENAQESARLNPRFVDARVDEYLRSHPQQPGRPTDAQARAAGLFPVLMEAHEGINQFEDKRIDVGFGTQTLSNIPGGARLLNSDQKALMQFANSYMNIASLILTGVTARPDEYTRYMSTYVGYHGDDDRTRMQKRRARELFNQSVLQRAQTGTGATSLSEVMDEVDRALASEQPAYPGEPPPLADGIPAQSRDDLIRALEDARGR